MSASNFHGVVNGSIPPNGTPARETVLARGGRRTAPAKRTGREPKKPGPELAGHIKTESPAQNTPMWPIHPVIWLQPEMRLQVPVSSGLRTERKHSVPSPEFVRGDMMPVSHPPLLETTVHPVLPRISQQLPASGLAPLGWDPRASLGTRKEDQE